jgi:putative transposase
MRGNCTRLRADEANMRSVHVRLYVHLAWGTAGRLPCLDPSRARRVHGLLARVCRGRKCVALAVGGVADHVHLLVGFHPTVAVSDLVRALKVGTSHFIADTLGVADFAWQEGYGAFSLRESECETVRRYIERQQEHHASATHVAEWEAPQSPVTREAGDLGRTAGGEPP